MYKMVDKHNWNCGNGLKFDGVNDTLTIGNISALDFDNTDSFTLTSWFKLISFGSSSACVLFSKIVTNPTIYGYSTRIYTSNQIGIIFTNNTVNRYKIVQLSSSLVGGLHHIAYVANGDALTQRMYVDGVEITNSPFYSPNVIGSSKNSGNLTLGTQTTDPIYTNYTNTIIYDSKIFNRALTSAEIFALYTKQNQIIPASAISNCVADWRFEDKQGTSLLDQSGNNYTGTLNGFTNTSLSSGNAWVDKYGNSIQQL